MSTDKNLILKKFVVVKIKSSNKMLCTENKYIWWFKKTLNYIMVNRMLGLERKNVLLM